VKEGCSAIKSCTVSLWAVACFLLPVVAQSTGEPPSVNLSRESLEGQFRMKRWDVNAPVDIRSRQMRVDFDQHRIVFWGEVRVTQEDFSLSAEEVTAVFGDHAEDVRRIVAKGNVRIEKADKVAWGREAVYDREKALIVLSGDPGLEQGRNFIRGDEIRVFLAEDRMDIAGGVRAEFRMQQEQERP